MMMESNTTETIFSRMLNLNGPMFLVACGIMLITLGSTIVRESLHASISIISGVCLIAIGGALYSFLYLKGSNLKHKYQYKDSDEDKYLELLSLIEPKIDQILRATQEKGQDDYVESTRAIELSPEERSSVIEHLRSNLTKELSEKVFETAKKEVDIKGLDAKQLINIRKEQERTKRRLNDEISALSRRGNLNLIIGGVTTVSAVALLSYIVLTAEISNGDTNAFVWHYVPRITVAIFIEVFSFFFLRLYRNSLSDIKYFQNELTNIDSKFIAMEAAIALQDKKATSEILSVLSQTERNSKLGKGESTVELEKLKVEKEGISQLLSSAKEIISTVKK